MLWPLSIALVPPSRACDLQLCAKPLCLDLCALHPPLLPGMARLSRCGQILLLLHRNWLLLSRDVKGALMQVALPIVIFLFLAGLKGESVVQRVDEQRNKLAVQPPPFEISAHRLRDSVLLYAPRGANSTAAGTGSDDASRSYVERIMDRLRAALDHGAVVAGGVRPSDTMVVGLDSAADVQRYWEESFAQQQQPAGSLAASSTRVKKVWAAVVFGDEDEAATPWVPLAPTLPCDVSYTLRLNGSMLPSSARGSEFVPARHASSSSGSGSGSSNQIAASDASTAEEGGSGFAADVGALESGSGAGASLATAQYLASGFLSLQRQVNQAVLDVRLAEQAAAASTAPPPSGSAALRSLFNSYTLSFQSYPSAAYALDPFHDLMVQIGGLYMVVGYLPLLQKLVVGLVAEKESGTKEAMKVAGLSAQAFVAGWYATYSILATIPVAATSLLSQAYGFYVSATRIHEAGCADNWHFMSTSLNLSLSLCSCSCARVCLLCFQTYTSTTVLFVLFFLYVQCLLLFAFCVSTLFNKSKLAGQVSSTVIFLLFLPQYLLPSSGDEPSLLGWAALLSPPVSFARGFAAVADAESAGVVLAFPSSLSGAPASAPYSLGVCLLGLLLDAGLLAAAALWMDQVIQADYGLAKPWDFMCRRGRGRLCATAGRQDQLDGDEDEENLNAEESQALHNNNNNNHNTTNHNTCR